MPQPTTNDPIDSSTEDAPTVSRLRGLWKRLLAMGLGLAVALGAAEVLLIFLIPAPLHFRYPQPKHLPDEQLGWVPVPNQRSFTIDQPVSVNSMGFRSPEIPLEREPDVIRIMCLGDSQTFGNGVAQDRIYAARLQELLREDREYEKVQVINAGVQAYDTLQQVWLLERLAPRLQPDIVTLGFYFNDIQEVLRKDRGSRVDRETGSRKRSRLKRFFPDRLIYFLKRSRVVTLIYAKFRQFQQQGRSTPYIEILQGRTPARFEESWRLIEEALTRARDLGARQGFRLIVFPIPSHIEFSGEFPDEEYRSRFIALAQKLGLEHFDPTPAMRRDGVTLEDGFLAWDRHMNADSHLRMAHMLRDRIRAEPAALPGEAPATRP